MLLLKVLEDDSQFHDAQNCRFRSNSLFNLLLSPKEKSGLGDTGLLFLRNLLSLGPYVLRRGFEFGPNERDQLLSCMISDELIRQLCITDFSIINRLDDLKHVNLPSEDTPFAIINMSDTRTGLLCGGDAVGGKIKAVEKPSEISARNTILGVPGLVTIACQFISELNERTIPELPRLLHALIPLYYRPKNASGNYLEVFRVLSITDGDTAPIAKYRDEEYRLEVKVDHDRATNSNIVSADLITTSDDVRILDFFSDGVSGSELIFADKGRVLSLEGAIEECWLAKGLREGREIVSDYFKAHPPHVGHVGEGDCSSHESRESDDRKGMIFVPCSKVNNSISSTEDPLESEPSLREKLPKAVLRLAGEGFYSDASIRQRLNDAKALYELTWFDFSGKEPAKRAYGVGLYRANGKLTLSQIRMSFGSLLASMNAYCDRYQGYRTSMDPYARVIRGSMNPGAPLVLYRYRSWDSEKKKERELKSARDGLVYLAEASRFNDANDSVALLSIDDIRDRMQKQITADNMARTIAFDWRYYEELIGCEDVERFASQMMKLAESDAKKEDFIDQILSKLDELSEAFRSEIRCACFCEDGCSPLMWAHYAADEGGGDCVPL